MPDDVAVILGKAVPSDHKKLAGSVAEADSSMLSPAQMGDG